MTRIRQETQVRGSDLYDDSLAPGPALESATTLEEDLNALRSQVSRALRATGGQWYDDLAAPTNLDTGGKRGVNDLNQSLHTLERKRLLVGATRLVDVTIPSGQNWVILSGAELPVATTVAIGTVTTAGSVAAAATLFGSHNLDTVPGSTLIEPANLCVVVDSATLAPVLSAGRPVFALLQSESTTDGSTATASTPNRLQLSFVRPNALCSDIEAVPVADIETRIVRYRSTVRKAFLDLNEYDLLVGPVGSPPSATTGPSSPTATTIAVTCLNTDVAGACVYVTGVVSPNVYSVRTVDLTQWSPGTSIGILISKSSSTTGTVQLSGIVKGVYTGLVPGSTYIAGVSGQITNTSPVPISGQRFFIQKMGWAMGTDEFLVSPSQTVTIIQG